MTYQATVCYLSDIRPHQNADKLKLANALGYNVIVGLDDNEHTLGVVFPEGGRLSHNMLYTNGLYRKNPATGEPMGGYFEDNGRVKAIRLRGANSEALWLPLNSLVWTGDSLDLVPGDTFTELNGEHICEKYYTPATLRAMQLQARKQGKKGKRAEDYAPDFARHFDTTQLRDAVMFLLGTTQVFTVFEKLHGTSARTGNVRWTKRTWWQNILAKFGLYRDKYRLVSGTRKVVLDPDQMGTDTGYYKGTNFRAEIHNRLQGKLKKDEILYYEVVGYSQGNTLIMPAHPFDKTSLKQAGIPESELSDYGNKMEYTYGCQLGRYAVFVYRITQGGVDLDFLDLQVRCAELGLAVVPYLGLIEIKETDTVQDILMKVEPFTRGKSVLGGQHIKEGVVLRKDNFGGRVTFMKYKGFIFCLLEGIRRNTEDYVDPEEIA